MIYLHTLFSFFTQSVSDKDALVDTVVRDRVRAATHNIFEQNKDKPASIEILNRAHEKLEALFKPYFAQWSVDELQEYRNWQTSDDLKHYRQALKTGKVSAELLDKYNTFKHSDICRKKESIDKAVEGAFQKIKASLCIELEQIDP